MAQKNIRAAVEPIARGLAESMGFEIVDIELVREGPGRYLRIYLDKDGGFTLDDCERFHRAVQPKLETIDYDFLEVSSPGADRPLKTADDFARAAGTQVEVRLYKPLDGSKVLEGTLSGFDEETIRIQTPAGEKELVRKDVALVKPVIHFDEADGGDETP